MCTLHTNTTSHLRGKYFIFLLHGLWQLWIVYKHVANIAVKSLYCLQLIINNNNSGQNNVWGHLCSCTRATFWTVILFYKVMGVTWGSCGLLWGRPWSLWGRTTSYFSTWDNSPDACTTNTAHDKQQRHFRSTRNTRGHSDTCPLLPSYYFLFTFPFYNRVTQVVHYKFTLLIYNLYYFSRPKRFIKLNQIIVFRDLSRPKMKTQFFFNLKDCTLYKCTTDFNPWYIYIYCNIYMF